MNDDDFRKIGDIVQDRIEQALVPIKKTLNEHSEKIGALWDQTAKLSVDMTEVQDTLKQHSVALQRIETKIDHTAENINQLAKRTSEVETKLGIAPLPELVTI